MATRTLAGKTVFITGASSGIGEALARRAAREGAAVAVTARREERLEALTQDIQRDGGRALAIAADVTQDGDLERAAASTREAFDRIDVVIANAGFGVSGPLDRLTLDDYRRQLETNLFGVLRTIYATLADLERSRGTIVLVGSAAGYVGLPGSGAYSISKAAVHSLAQSLAGELAPRGIAVVLITPGFVETDIRRVDNRGNLREGASDFVPGWLQMSSDQAAAEILDAAVGRDRERILTRHAKAIVALQRYAPGFVSGVLRLSGKLPGKRSK
ncbi:Oxidoreductase, short-chain dehydrogenase/reductase family protein [Minicystis rosea]|nr:Oxidoreductase, short-chain dehydrogenase/reductase family protein [Minicystis rosea]